MSMAICAPAPEFWCGVAIHWSEHSRTTSKKNLKRINAQQEWLVIYSGELLKIKFYDYLIFGRRHLPLDIQLNEDSRYINLGEWINYNSYAVLDGQELTLLDFEPLNSYNAKKKGFDLTV